MPTTEAHVEIQSVTALSCPVLITVQGKALADSKRLSNHLSLLNIVKPERPLLGRSLLVFAWKIL